MGGRECREGAGWLRMQAATQHCYKMWFTDVPSWWPDALSSGPPKVSEEVKLLQYTKHRGQGFGMFCKAQGYPLPAYR